MIALALPEPSELKPANPNITQRLLLLAAIKKGGITLPGKSKREEKAIYQMLRLGWLEDDGRSWIITAKGRSVLLEYRDRHVTATPAPQPDPFTTRAMIGAPIVYRVPSAMGWRQLRGSIVRVHDCGILVRETHLGGESTINAEWIVSYDWTETKTATEAAV